MMFICIDDDLPGWLKFDLKKKMEYVNVKRILI